MFVVIIIIVVGVMMVGYAVMLCDMKVTKSVAGGRVVFLFAVSLTV